MRKDVGIETNGRATDSDLEREFDLGRGAIRMVTSGHMLSVTIDLRAQREERRPGQPR